VTSILSANELENQESCFSPEELSQLAPYPIPKHVAIIMDGNRRWAKKRLLPSVVGHWRGVDALMNTVEAARDIGIETVTVYAFSSENWNRSKAEKSALFKIFELTLTNQCAVMIQNGIRLHSIGDTSPFPATFVKILEETKAATAHCDSIDLVLALNYGGRDDIRRALVSLIDDCDQKRVSKESITEELISSYLDTSYWTDPDLLIRTSGENRISNFLLWQLAYTEVYFTETLWPDFTEQSLLKAVIDYQQRNRRFGS